MTTCDPIQLAAEAIAEVFFDEPAVWCKLDTDDQARCIKAAEEAQNAFAAELLPDKTPEVAIADLAVALRKRLGLYRDTPAWLMEGLEKAVAASGLRADHLLNWKMRGHGDRFSAAREAIAYGMYYTLRGPHDERATWNQIAAVMSTAKNTVIESAHRHAVKHAMPVGGQA